jgi:hypothetical protein
MNHSLFASLAATRRSALSERLPGALFQKVCLIKKLSPFCFQSSQFNGTNLVYRNPMPRDDFRMTASSPGLSRRALNIIVASSYFHHEREHACLEYLLQLECGLSM